MSILRLFDNLRTQRSKAEKVTKAMNISAVSGADGVSGGYVGGGGPGGSGGSGGSRSGFTLHSEGDVWKSPSMPSIADPDLTKTSHLLDPLLGLKRKRSNLHADL